MWAEIVQDIEWSGEGWSDYRRGWIHVWSVEGCSEEVKGGKKGGKGEMGKKGESKERG